MIMTKFAGLGNGVTKAKADPVEYEITFSVNDANIGSIRGALINGEDEEHNYTTATDPVPAICGNEGDRVLLSVDYIDYSDERYRIKGWSITPNVGTLEETDKGIIYTIGSQSVEIKAVFEEKERHSVTMDDWIFGEDEKKPTYKDSTGTTKTAEECIYFVNEACQEMEDDVPVDETTPDNSGAEGIGLAPKNPGRYYVKTWLLADKKYKSEEVILSFCIREAVEIGTSELEIPYSPDDPTFAVAELFDIPDNAGDRTYGIVVQNTEEGVGAGTLSDDNILTITKCGNINIELITSQTDTAATGSAIAVLTVTPAVFTADTTSLILEDGEYAYSGTVCSPTLTVKYGESTLSKGTNYEIDTASTMEATEVGTYTVSINGIGNFTGSASTTWRIKDSNAPVITGVENGNVYYGPVSITISDTNLSSVSLTKGEENLGNVSIQNGTASIELEDLGAYTISAFDDEENETTCSFTIAKKEITIVGQDKSTTYNSTTPYDVSLLFTVSDADIIPTYSIVTGDAEGTGAGSLSGNSLTVTKAGAITIKATVAESTYISSAEATAVLTVAKAEGSASITLSNVTYGSDITPTVSSSTNTGDYTIVYAGKGSTQYASSSTAPVEVGSYTATVTYPANDLYNESVNSVDFNIVPATLTVTANNLSKKVGAADPKLTYEVTGFKYNNDTKESVLSGSLTRATGETEGEYPISQGTLAANKNYTISFTGATFTIIPEDSFVISVEKNIEAAGTIVGAGTYVSGSTVTLIVTPNSGYKFVKWQENNDTVSTDKMYSFTASWDRNLVAVFEEKTTPELSISVAQWIYGDSSDNKVTVSGNEENGTETIIYYIDSDYTTMTNVANSSAESEGGVPKKAGTYYVKISVDETANYKSGSAQTSFAIIAKNLSDDMLSIKDNAQKSYEYAKNVNHTPELIVKDGNTVLNTNDYAIDQDSVIEAEAVGTYTIKVNGIGNYSGSAVITWTIVDTVLPSIENITENGIYTDKVTVTVNDAYLSEVTLKKNNENAQIYTELNETMTFDVEGAGSYEVIAKDTSGNTSTCNFKIIETPNITVNNETITYAPGTYDVSGLFTIPQNAGAATYSIVTGTDAGTGTGRLSGKDLTIEKAGTIKIKVTTAITDTAAAGTATALLTVNKAEGNVNLEILNAVYGTLINPSVSSTTNTGEYTIVYAGRGTTVYEVSSTAPVEAGTYTATVTYPENDLYKKAVQSFDFEISPAILTIIADDLSKMVGENDPTLTYSVDGLVNNDVITDVLEGSLARVEGETVGTYAISQNTLKANKNYSIAFTGATFTIIEKEDLDLSISVAQWTYGDSSEGKVTVTGNTGNGAETLVYFTDADYSIKTTEANSGATTEGGVPKYAGTYYLKVNVAETGNYKSGSAQTSFKISEKAISDNMLSLDKSAFEYVYGTTYTPVLTVKDGNNNVLTEGTDYEIVTAESTTTSSTVGSYIIKVNGKGNYTGTATITWKVSKDDIIAPVINGVANNGTYVDKVTISVTDKKLKTIILKKVSGSEKYYSVANGSASFEVTEAGTYTITARDSAGNETVYGFKLILTPDITSANTEIVYNPETYDVASLFSIPQNAGAVTYSIVTGDDAGTGLGSISENKLTVTKAGTIKINVSTAATDTAATGSAIAVITVAKADGAASIELADTVYGTAVNPTVSSTTNTGNYIITYVGKGETVYTASSSAPTETGSYTATVKYLETDLYKEAVNSVDFNITPATLKITAINRSKKVGEEDPELTYTIDGLVDNDIAADILTGKIERAAGDDIGTYPIRQGTLSTNKNYIIEFTGAVFTVTSKDSFAVSITVSDEDAGVVTGDGSYDEDTIVTLTAETKSGYKFVKWAENDVQLADTKVYSFKITGDRDLEAVFEEKNTPVLAISVSQWNYGDSSEGKVTYTGNEGNGTATIEYFTDEACTIKTNSSNGAEVEGGVPKYAGAYYVKVIIAETDDYKSASAQASFNIVQANNNQENINSNNVQPVNNVTGISVESTGTKLNISENSKDSCYVTATVTPENADNKMISWTVSKDGIVDLSSVQSNSGNSISVTAVSAGEVTLTATAAGDIEKTASITINVVAHEHVWALDGFNWTVSKDKTGTDSNGKDIYTYTCAATAEFSCEGCKKNIILDAKVESVSTYNNGYIIYKAIVTGPDEIEYQEWCLFDAETGEVSDYDKPVREVKGGNFLVLGVEETYPFTNAAIKPDVVVVDVERDVVLAKGTDYTVSYKNNKKLNATATITVKGKGNYAGKNAEVTFVITDPRDGIKNLASGAIKTITISEKSFEYNGHPQYPKTITVEMKDKTKMVFELNENGEYVKTSEGETTVALSISNNINKGTATLLVSGKDKTKKVSFKINAVEISKAEFTVDDATWGVKAENVKVYGKLGDLDLVEGQDFKVKFTAKNAGNGAGNVKISGKGNFKKSINLTYNVNPLEITPENIIVTGNITDNKASKIKISVVDNYGNAIAKKMYSFSIVDENGSAVDKKTVLNTNMKIIVNATTKAGNNILFPEGGISIDVALGKNISKTKGVFKVNNKTFFKTYTGEPITLTEDDFAEGKIDSKGLKLGEDFEIVSYKNNIKKGTMTVTVRGIGEYGGTKTFKVKIKAKPFN